jgi:hypothetical protein
MKAGIAGGGYPGSPDAISNLVRGMREADAAPSRGAAAT